MVVAMRVAYNGGAFFGFQSQSDVLSVSSALESALRSVGIFERLFASGRTDKGVHASAQVVSLRIPKYWEDLESLRQHLNTKLSPHIFIKRIWRVENDFNARFMAKRRGYCYLLSSINSPFLTPFSLHYKLQNPALIKEALKIFVGTHNFSAFMTNDGSGAKNPVRTIYRTKLTHYKEFWILSFWGNGFLRSQVRLMVGFLLEIDKGNLTLQTLKAQLQGEMIYRIPISPNGLFLTRVDY